MTSLTGYCVKPCYEQKRSIHISKRAALHCCGTSTGASRKPSLRKTSKTPFGLLNQFTARPSVSAILKTLHASSKRHNQSVYVTSADLQSEEDESKGPLDDLSTGQIGLLSGAALTAVLGSLALVYQTESVQDYLYGDGLTVDAGAPIGNLFASSAWALSLYYASPIQLLLFFLGRIDVERPSDQVLKIVGDAFGLDVRAKGYEPPASVKAVTVAVFVASGCSVAWLSDWALGDPIWGVSTGIGSCLLAGVYELGRPQRLSANQAQQLQDQWQDFSGWADQRLVRTGRCHFKEISTAFRNTPGNSKYRSQEALADSNLRLMIANWCPTAERTPSGFYKGVSLVQVSDPFKPNAKIDSTTTPSSSQIS
mmetsp:Transcript_12321/g.14730  ORF Transcript_12321/g.14730 Transcript_12321/m.14730 type:complete len:367 (+) Transcript_12321:192-1292(+)|eukprot:CAMPEP_0197866382 /NCGR_PEP_ID=MMETSP1438-20131217/44187_1 /TAXON_ID=1461541 /ORGANISM="Pterosperma sp., Strain CCMP1384" /LENGTH=366 /DNA_ID=CAMNT_0043484947 /DNA_START=183 /DNA_END=1283 /DNA_ORIENTATION=+